MQNKIMCVGMVLLGLTFASQAQDKKPRAEPLGTAYKQTLPDGSIIYTDKPNRTMKIDKTLVPEPQLTFVPRGGTSIYVSPGYNPQKPMVSGLNPGVPGTPIPSMPPLPGDSVIRPGLAVTPAPLTSGPGVATDTSPGGVEAEIAKADEALARALEMQKSGLVPEPGDRNGTATGGSRLNATYSQRQDELASNVRRAQAELDRLLLKRRAQ